MRFSPNTIYHVYNQGNNKIPIFYQEDNYSFFLEKMEKHLLPYCELLCFCLMPNHFHWLLIPNASGLETNQPQKPRFGRFQNLQTGISILLRSYTRAINAQEKRSGSLFRPRTKIKDGWIDQVITVDGKKKELFFYDDLGYARQCFEYIHQNPVKAGLTLNPDDWPYSSAREYFASQGSGNSLCNQDLAKELGLFP